MKTSNRLLTIIFVIASTIVSCGGGGSSSSPCDDLGLRVFGGEQCKRGGPVVGIVSFDSSGNEIGYCSGTLITLDDVLTAGHCITSNASSYRVATEDGLYDVVRGAVHPDYSPGNVHDLAILTLDRPTEIGPVPLGITLPLATGDRVTAFGLGNNEANEIKLKAATLEIAHVEVDAFITTFDATQAAICQGDSGGPVTKNLNGTATLVGVTSVTFLGCQEGSASGFVNVQSPRHYSFIKQYAADVGTL